MRNKGNEIIFTFRKKEFEEHLLKELEFDSVCFGKHYSSISGKLFGLIKFNALMLKTILSYNPDITLSHGSPYAAQVSWLLNKPHISLEDTFNKEQLILYKPFTKSILTGNYPHPFLGKKEVSFNGYHETFYLHPKRFKPSKNVLIKYGIPGNKKYVILRFVAWSSSHDKPNYGISLENKKKIVKELSEYANVYITSEEPLTDDLEKYRLNINPEDIHHILAFSKLFLGESATMASESASLGVPAVYIDPKGRYYINDIEEKYGLVRYFKDTEFGQKNAINAALSLIQEEDRLKFLQARSKLTSKVIDATAFLVWFVENYPESHAKMKKETKYDLNFR